MSGRKPYFYIFKGIVQNVMFRQTFLRACLKLDIDAGATNHPIEKDRCDLTLFGTESNVNNLMSKIILGKWLNSWGAKVEKIEIIENGIPPYDHSINTGNIKKMAYNENIEFYI